MTRFFDVATKESSAIAGIYLASLLKLPRAK